MANFDVEATLAAAQRSQENKMDTVRALAEANAAFREAETRHVGAWSAALNAGWSSAELKKFGLDEPAKKQRVRRRAAQKKTHQDSPQPSGQGEQTE